MATLYAHPTITSSPDLIRALQTRFGLRAIVEGARVRLIQPGPRLAWSAPAPSDIPLIIVAEIEEETP